MIFILLTALKRTVYNKGHSLEIITFLEGLINYLNEVFL